VGRLEDARYAAAVAIWTSETLAPMPSLGWITEPTPITPLPAQAEELGLGWFGVKRDDLLAPLRGGTKARKLDVILATEPFASASRWASVGAIGSGHLASLALAAAELGRELESHCFFEPVSDSVMENLACIASGSESMHYRSNRLSLAFFSPRVLLGSRRRPAPALPPGGSVPEGVAGIVAGALELADQIRAGDLPRPDEIYLPWGTGGTAVGISLGLALAGMPIPVRAVATVEPWFVSRRGLSRLQTATLAYLRSQGLPVPPGFSAPLPTAVRGHVGPGYGHITPESVDACRWMGDAGLRPEPVYGGKALSALRQSAASLRGKKILYWLTSHRGGLPSTPGWTDRLPAKLRRHLHSGPGLTRRRLLGASAALVGAVGWRHLVGYGDFEGWSGLVLNRREAHVLAAAAEAIVPDAPGPLPLKGPSAAQLVTAVDRYLSGMPALMRLEIHGLFELLEQGTLLNGAVSRLTTLDPSARRRFLARLEALGGPLGDASRGVRDLCLLGWYQDPRTWDGLGYGGPWVPEGGLGGVGKYAGLVAPPGQDPEGARR
jgi:D-cysteine desulfhydrase